MSFQIKKLNDSHRCSRGFVSRFIYNSQFQNKELFSAKVIDRLKKTSVVNNVLYSDVVRNNVKQQSPVSQEHVSMSVNKIRNQLVPQCKHVETSVHKNSTFSEPCHGKHAKNKTVHNTVHTGRKVDSARAFCGNTEAFVMPVQNKF